MNKDVYLKIADEVSDDRTIVNMLSVNKKYYTDAFFKTLFNKRYPLLAQLKEEKYANDSWKEFYLIQLYYLDLLKRKYNIPYIPVKSFVPERIVERILRNPQHNEDKIIASILLELYAEMGDLTNFVKVETLPRLSIIAAPFAIIGGNMQILENIIEKAYSYLSTENYIKLLNELIFLSIEYDKAEMFKFLVEVYEANANWNSIMNLVVRLSKFIKTQKVENPDIVSQVNKLADAYGVL